MTFFLTCETVWSYFSFSLCGLLDNILGCFLIEYNAPVTPVSGPVGTCLPVSTFSGKVWVLVKLYVMISVEKWKY